MFKCCFNGQGFILPSWFISFTSVYTTVARFQIGSYSAKKSFFLSYPNNLRNTAAKWSHCSLELDSHNSSKTNSYDGYVCIKTRPHILTFTLSTSLIVPFQRSYITVILFLIHNFTVNLIRHTMLLKRHVI